MMDSLLLDSLSPIAFTKITTSSKPPRHPIAAKKSMSNDGHSTVSTAYRPINNLGANAPNGLGIGGAPPVRNSKQRLPTQGMCSLTMIYPYAAAPPAIKRSLPFRGGTTTPFRTDCHDVSLAAASATAAAGLTLDILVTQTRSRTATDSALDQQQSQQQQQQ